MHAALVRTFAHCAVGAVGTEQSTKAMSAETSVPALRTPVPGPGSRVPRDPGFGSPRDPPKVVAFRLGIFGDLRFGPFSEL